ncbi:hypothetical protein WG66_014466 [Moniliophthora roreri]|uniref:Uncharacterized protein n=1 Tax=Moniliophthora roreri TaxID=221103 RepID=A0A0W0GAG9_MONRR|nr:hypothetical protein WG66_014466 [Moniliophthora roreri]
MKLIVFVASLIAGASAAVNVPASSATITPPTDVHRNVAPAFERGNYVALPRAPAEANQGGCGSFVFFINDANPSVGLTGILVDFTDDDVLLLGPSLYEEASLGVEGGFSANYNVSPLVG